MLKKFIVLLGVILNSVAFGGPFVSGGMPDYVKCGDSNTDYQFEVRVLGKTGGGTLLYNRAEHGEQIDLDCAYEPRFIGSIPGTQLQYVCGTVDNPRSIEIYKKLGTLERWAFVYPRNQSYPVPLSLSCE